jgi:ribosome maturation factor RimP
MATTDEAALPGQVRALVHPLADALDVEVLDVQVKGQRGRRLVRVVADAADLAAAAGLDIDTIATLSRQLGDALDADDLIAGAYTLEVTSPGADQPLTRARDFARNRGREVRIARQQDDEGAPPLTGTVATVTDDAVTLTTPDGEVSVPLGDVAHATVVLPW